MEFPVTIHASGSIPWQKRYAEALLKGFKCLGRSAGVTGSNDVNAQGTHVILGPNLFKTAFASLRAADRDVITINRAFVGSVLGDEENPYVAIGWNGYNNNADFPFNIDALYPHSRVTPELRAEVRSWQYYEHGEALILGEFHPEPAFYARALEECERYGYPRVFRPHPDSDFLPSGMRASPVTTLKEAIDAASVVLTHHSTAAAEALLRGVPVVSYDRESICWPVTSHDLGTIKLCDRDRWLEWLAWTQWTIEEIARGEPWEWF